LDHCESPRIAYEHIQPVLNELAKFTNAKAVQIWDAFYCDGTVKRHLVPKGLFYLLCSYVMPEWSERPEHVEQDGKTATPYLSSWYIHAGDRTDELMDQMSSLSK
jgi:hypothetical protein